MKRMKMKWFMLFTGILAVILLGALLEGCGTSMSPLRVTQSDVVGTWVGTSEGRGAEGAELKFTEGGRFSSKNLPLDLIDDEHSGSGSWWIWNAGTENANLHLRPEMVDGSIDFGEEEYGVFYKDGSSLYLIFYMGDPDDDGNSYTFVKKK